MDRLPSVFGSPWCQVYVAIGGWVLIGRDMADHFLPFQSGGTFLEPRELGSKCKTTSMKPKRRNLGPIDSAFRVLHIFNTKLRWGRCRQGVDLVHSRHLHQVAAACRSPPGLELQRSHLKVKAVHHVVPDHWSQPPRKLSPRLSSAGRLISPPERCASFSFATRS